MTAADGATAYSTPESDGCANRHIPLRGRQHGEPRQTAHSTNHSARAAGAPTAPATGPGFPAAVAASILGKP